MRLHLPTLATVVAAGLFLSSSPSFADHAPFACETRFFDPYRNSTTDPPSFNMVACYRPSAIRAAYGLTGLLKAGFSGAGQTIVILAPFGSPSALEDLKLFDEAFAPPKAPSYTFNVVTMPGTPPFEGSDNQIHWAMEVSHDVQWAHAMAPGANIVLVAAASGSDDDLQAGFNYAINHRLGNVVSMSFGLSEAFYASPDGLRRVAKWERAFSRARERHITLFAPAGDYGSTNLDETGNAVLTFRNVSYPASSPQVTGVGGTTLFFGTGDRANPSGTYLRETVWNDQPEINSAGGGGVSALFSRPRYQDELPSSARRSLGYHRGVPDVAFSAGQVGGELVVYNGGWFIAKGTSGGAAQWAGVIADLNQALGRPMGFINRRLYKQGLIGLREREERERGERRDRDDDRVSLFHDVTVGNNCFNTDPSAEIACMPGSSVPGFSATPGWDPVTGWGTPNFGALVKLFDRWADDDDDNDE